MTASQREHGSELIKLDVLREHFRSGMSPHRREASPGLSPLAEAALEADHPQLPVMDLNTGLEPLRELMGL